MKYVNLTPRWTEILPTWLMMFSQAVEGDCSNPDLVKDNATKEFFRMAEAADRYCDLVTVLRKQGWDDDTFADNLSWGRELNEQARTTVHESIS